MSFNIANKEAIAIDRVLRSFSAYFTNSRVDVLVDNQAVIYILRLRSDKAYSLVTLNVEKDLQVYIISVTDPFQAWTTLQKQFEVVSVIHGQIVRLNRKFYAASMKEGDDIMQHLAYMTS